MRVDAHHHVWRVDRGDYGWLVPSAALAPICRDFGVEDLRPLLAAARIDATVLVQAAPTAAETDFLLGVAAESGGLVKAVVGWADLDAADASETLASLATQPLLKAVRPMLQDLDDPAWILRPGVASALAAMPALGLRYEALVTPRELPFVVTMAQRNQELAVVIDHVAKPAIASGGWRPWADDIARAARSGNVFCKLSGLVTEAGAGWTVDALRAYVDHVLRCFGPGRVIWGSDWPVLTLAAAYGVWVAATDALLARCTAGERDAIMGGNAVAFYGLA